MKYVFAILVFTSTTFASVQQDLLTLQQQWLQANYSSDKQQQEQRFEQLINLAQISNQKNPQQAELLIWQGIILSSAAGVEGGLSALSKVKQAKQLFEQALALDDKALQGSAYTSLGALYYQVPGWPIAFGNDTRAEQLLKQALDINPQGIDANYFYADFLYQRGEYSEALNALYQAQKAPPRPGREGADQARQLEINQLIAKVKRQI